MVAAAPPAPPLLPPALPLGQGPGVAAAPLHVLRPGTFDILLCVDTSETAGGASKSRKDLLLPELQRNGVDFEVRKLNLGDYLWIAKEKVTGAPPTGSSAELVLDYIVERKRMDDLSCSITDGRFKEQKFRLKQCCSSHSPIYLVEDFGSNDSFSMPKNTLEQAILNTQVIDDIFVKRSHDLKESVAYLTLVTQYLQLLYSSKKLLAYPRNALNEAKWKNDPQSLDQRLITFNEFMQSTRKNKGLTIGEIFAKQLMTISGVSADKAKVILDHYSTPALLIRAYEKCQNEKEKTNMLSSLKYGQLQRKIGPSVSKTVHNFYCGNN